MQIGDLVVKLTADVGEFIANTTLAMNRVDEVSGRVENSMQSFAAVGDRLTGLGAGLTAGLTVPIAGAAAVMVNFGSEFDSALAGLQGRAGMTAAEMGVLSAQSLKLGMDTEHSTVAIVKGMTELGAAGRTAAEVGTMIGPLSQQVTALGGSWEDNTAMTNAAMTAFGMAAGETQRVVDVLANVTMQGSSSQAELALALRNSQAVASASGVKFDELAGAITVLDQNAIKGEVSGTALKNMMTTLVAPSRAARGMFNELGIEYDSTAFKSLGLNDKLELIKQKMESSVAPVDRAGVMMRGFGQEAGAAAITLVNNAGRLDDVTRKMNEAGTAAGLQQAKLNTLEGAWNQLTGSVEAAAIQGFLAVKDVLIGIVQTGTDMLNQFVIPAVQWFGQLPQPIQMGALALAAVAAAIGPLLVVAGTLISSVASISAGWGALVAVFAESTILTGLIGTVGTLVSGISILTAGVVAVGAAFGAAVAYFAIAPYFDQIAASARILWTGFTDVISVVGSLVAQFATMSVIPTVTSWAQTLGSVLSTVLKPVMDFVAGAAANLGVALGGAANFLRQFVSVAQTVSGPTTAMATGANQAATAKTQLAGATGDLTNKLGAAVPKLANVATGHRATGTAARAHTNETDQLRSTYDRLQSSIGAGAAWQSIVRHFDAAANSSQAWLAKMRELYTKNQEFYRQIADNSPRLAALNRDFEKVRDSMDQWADKLSGEVGVALTAYNVQTGKTIEITQQLDQALLASTGLSKITAEVQAVEDAYKRLGITSTAEMGRVIREADDAYLKIADAAGKGTASERAAYEAAIKAKVDAYKKAGQDIPLEIAAEHAKIEAKTKDHTDKVGGLFGDMTKQVSTVITNFAQDAVKGLFSGEGSFVEKGITALKGLGEAFVGLLVEKATTALTGMVSGVLDSMFKKLGDILGKAIDIGTSLAGTAANTTVPVPPPAVPPVPPPAVPPAPPAPGGAAGAVGAGITGIVGAVASVATAISSIFGNFQMAAMNKTLDLIEGEVRKTSIFTGQQSQSVLWSTQTTAERLNYVNASLDDIKSVVSTLKQPVIEFLGATAGNSYWTLKKLDDIHPAVLAIRGGLETAALSVSTLDQKLQRIADNTALAAQYLADLAAKKNSASAALAGA